MRSKDYMVLPHFPATTLAVLILDGVLDRFPLLRGACIEYGAAWVPSWIDRLDRTYSFFRKTEEELARLGRKPSEYVAEQIKFTPDSSERVASLTDELGPGLLMFSTDFPHFEGGEDPIGAFEEGLNGIPEEAKTQFYKTNFAQLVGLDKFTV